MQFIRKSIVRQFIFGVLGALILLSVISSFYQINQVHENSRLRLTFEVERMLAQLDDKISNMLYSRNNQLDAIFTNPSVIEAINSIEVRGLQADEHPKLIPVQKFFNHVVRLDPELVEIFFTTTATWEYFDKEGKNDDPDYYINKRPFWKEFLSQMNHYVNDPYRDHEGDILMTFRSPVFNYDKKLIGTAGIDLNLEKVNKELANIQSIYAGVKVFVVSGTGLMVSFPDMSKQMLKMEVSELETKNIDEIYAEYGAFGFSELWRNFKLNGELNHELQWNNEKYLVYMSKFNRETPEVHWNIAVMIPEAEISKPVQKSIFDNLFFISIFVLVLGLWISWFSSWKLRPLKQVESAMRDISEGSADLTQRININRDDEIGMLSIAFNIFIKKIQSLVSESSLLAQQFKDNAESALNSTQDTQVLIEKQKNQLMTVLNASVEMKETSMHVAKRNDDISKITSTTKEGVSSGGELLFQATDKITQLAAQIVKAADVVRALEQETNNIGVVVETIRGIAEQTNLLALNAAIEAARAGEQGRGFAVVADEVRSLASRTQEATAHIQDIVASLQGAADNAVQVMMSSQSEAEQGKEFTQKISHVFDNILASMTDLEQHMVDIATTISEQSETSSEMNNLITDIDKIASKTVDQSLGLSEQIHSTEQKSNELLNNLNKFKF